MACRKGVCLIAPKASTSDNSVTLSDELRNTVRGYFNQIISNRDMYPHCIASRFTTQTCSSVLPDSDHRWNELGDRIDWSAMRRLQHLRV